jgi:hypothetical protein
MKRMTIVIGVMSNLVLFFTIKYIHPPRFFFCIVKTGSCQFVGASANHLPCISKEPLYCIGIHHSRIDSLTIFYAEYIYGCDMAKQQGLDTKPSLVCKKKCIQLLSSPSPSHSARPSISKTNLEFAIGASVAQLHSLGSAVCLIHCICQQRHSNACKDCECDYTYLSHEG